LTLPAVGAKRYGGVEFELRVFNPSAAFAAVAVRSCEQSIECIVDLAQPSLK
jgi:hypothetical protein